MYAIVEFVPWTDECVLKNGPILVCPDLSKVPIVRLAYNPNNSSLNTTDGVLIPTQNVLQADLQEINTLLLSTSDTESSPSDQSQNLLAKLRSELPTILKHFPDSGNVNDDNTLNPLCDNKQISDIQQDIFPSIETDSLERESIINVLSPDDIFDRHVESLSDDVFETESDTKRRLGIDSTVPSHPTDIQNGLQSNESTHPLTSVSHTDITTPDSTEYSSSCGSFIADFEPGFVPQPEHEVDRREEFIFAEDNERIKYSQSQLSSNGGKIDPFSDFCENPAEDTCEPNACKQLNFKDIVDNQVLINCSEIVENGPKNTVDPGVSDCPPVEVLRNNSPNINLEHDDHKDEIDSAGSDTNACIKHWSLNQLNRKSNLNRDGRNDETLPIRENQVPCIEILHRNHETIEHKGFCEYSKIDNAATNTCHDRMKDSNCKVSSECEYVNKAEVERYINNILKYALESVLKFQGDGYSINNVYCNYQEVRDIDNGSNPDIVYSPFQEYNHDIYLGTLAPIPEVDSILENYVSESIYNDISLSQCHPRSRMEVLQPIPEVENKTDTSPCRIPVPSDTSTTAASITESSISIDSNCLNGDKARQQIPTDSNGCYDIEGEETIQSNGFKANDNSVDNNFDNERFGIKIDSVRDNDKWCVNEHDVQRNKRDSKDATQSETKVDTSIEYERLQQNYVDSNCNVKEQAELRGHETMSKQESNNQPVDNSSDKLESNRIESMRTEENIEEQLFNIAGKEIIQVNKPIGNTDEIFIYRTESNEEAIIESDSNKENDNCRDRTQRTFKTNSTIDVFSDHKKSEDFTKRKKDEDEYYFSAIDLNIDSREGTIDVAEKETVLDTRQNIEPSSNKSMLAPSLIGKSDMINSGGMKKISDKPESASRESSVSNLAIELKPLGINNQESDYFFKDNTKSITPTECDMKGFSKEIHEENDPIKSSGNQSYYASNDSRNDIKLKSETNENIQKEKRTHSSVDKQKPPANDSVHAHKTYSQPRQEICAEDSSPRTDASKRAKMLSKILKSNLSSELGRRPEYRAHSRYQSNSFNLEDHNTTCTEAWRNRSQYLRKVKSLDLDYPVAQYTGSVFSKKDLHHRKDPRHTDLQHKTINSRSISTVDSNYARNDFDDVAQDRVIVNPMDCNDIDKRKLYRSKTLDIKQRPQTIGVIFNDLPTKLGPKSNESIIYQEHVSYKDRLKEESVTANRQNSNQNDRKQYNHHTVEEIDRQGNGTYHSEINSHISTGTKEAGKSADITVEKTQSKNPQQIIKENDTDPVTKRRNAFKEGTFKVKRVASDDMPVYDRPEIKGVSSPSTEIKDYIDAISVENKYYNDTFTLHPETRNDIEETVNQIYNDTKKRIGTDQPDQEDKHKQRSGIQPSNKGHSYKFEVKADKTLKTSKDNKLDNKQTGQTGRKFDKKEIFSSSSKRSDIKSGNRVDRTLKNVTDEYICTSKQKGDERDIPTKSVQRFQSFENADRSKAVQRHQSFEKSNVYDNIGISSKRVKTDQSSQDRTAGTEDRSLINSPGTRGFNQNNGRSGSTVTKPGNTDNVKRSSERANCRSGDYVAASFKRNKGRVNEMRIQEHLEKKQKDGPLSLTDAYGSMETNDTHTGHALTNSANHLSESMTSLSNRHAPIASPSRQGTLNKQQSLQSSHSELNGEHRHEEGIKFERLKNLPEEELMVKIKEIIGHMERLEDYHRGDGMRIQKMLGDMYWDYTHMREMIGDCMAENGYAVVSMTMLKTLNSIGIFKNDDVWFPTYYTYNTMWNFTDASSKLAKALSENDAVRLLTLNCGHKPYINAIHSKNVYYVVKASLSILHNIARNSGMKHLFDENKTSETIMPFLESEDEMLKILATLTIANIVDEEENKTIIAESGTIHDIVNWIEKAVSLPRRRYKGFTPQELTEGLNKLAVNDANKMRIVDEGALQMFLQMLQHDDIREQSSAARIVWTLSFDKDVRQKINENTELVSVMEKLTDSTNKSLQTNCSGALWVIRGDNEVNNEKRPKTNKNKSHVFLSYAWSDKEIVLNIRDRLRAEGYAMWIDIEKMGKATLETMTEAIENSAVVLVCMSEKYKQSPNCRTEAEYTFQLKKDYIPLMMQKKYRPDGWVGTILGAKLYFDFSGKYPFDKSFQGLLKELRGRGKVTPNTTPGDSNDHTDSAMVHSMSLSSHTSAGTPVHHMPLNSAILNMGQEELIKWLRNVKLTECIPAFMEFDGRLLMQLKIMRTEAPEFFYQCLEKRLNMSLIEILKFTRALEELQ